MPAPVSRKQYRYMFAILHGKAGSSSRGDRVPKSVAGKYVGGKTPDDLPESKGKEHEGGRWDETHHSKDKKRVEDKRTERKKTKASLRKSFEDLYKGKGAGVIVINDQGHILLGRDSNDGLWSGPGGHVESGETFEEAAKRELKEEAGLTAKLISEIGKQKLEGNDATVFLVDSYEGKLGAKTDGELKDLKFFNQADIPWNKLRECTAYALQMYFEGRCHKSESLLDKLTIEDLKKNIIRSQVGSDVVFEMSHADSLKLVGKGTFKFLRSITADMTDEDFKNVPFDNYMISIRKHANDVYSGRVTDGHKLVHQWTNRSLPGMAAELMSVFEWYSPEDEAMLENMAESDMSDDALEGGLTQLTDHYRKHNIANIYSEMETIRSEIRQGMAVDLQQVEQRIMKLFDKLEHNILSVVDGHNKFTGKVGDDIDEIHGKLVELQSKLEEMGKRPTKVEAFSTQPANPNTVHQENYPYLPKPQVVVHPDGRITISFGGDWSNMDRENFLNDMKAKALKKTKV